MKIILINGLTLLRIPFSIFFCSAILYTFKPNTICAILFLLIGVSDYLDGKLARRYNAQTRIGAKLDVITDFFFIISACLTLISKAVLPKWMAVVVILKFLEFLTTSFLSRNSLKNKSIFLFDPVGRIVAVLLYLTPILALLLLYYCSDTLYELILNIFCIAITIMAVVSSTFRVTSLIKSNIII